jgi:competence protein ComGC
MNKTTPAANVSERNSALAVWSLWLGVLNLVCFSIFSAVPAVICGHLARSRIRRSGGVLRGDGLAITGLVTGYIGIAFALFLIPMMAAIAIPNFVKAWDTAQRNACVNQLRQLDSAKQSWALEHNRADDAMPVPADLDKYLRVGFHGLQCPKGGSYEINSVGEPPTCSIPGHELPDN